MLAIVLLASQIARIVPDARIFAETQAAADAGAHVGGREDGDAVAGLAGDFDGTQNERARDTMPACGGDSGHAVDARDSGVEEQRGGPDGFSLPPAAEVPPVRAWTKSGVLIHFAVVDGHGL